MHVASAVSKATKTNKTSKANDTYGLDNDSKSENFNFEHLKIEAESDWVIKKAQGVAK